MYACPQLADPFGQKALFLGSCDDELNGSAQRQMVQPFLFG